MYTIPSGVIKDPRPAEAIAVDYKHIAGSVPIQWKELDLNAVQLTSKRYQNGSYSCVFQSGASALEALTGKVISATPYFWRKNYPGEGSWIQDMGDIFYNRFTTTEALSSSQWKSEAQMNQIKQLTTFLGITGYKQPAIKNIDLIAEAIEAYGQCIVTYESNQPEYYYAGDIPKYLGSPITFAHAICGQAYGLINGEKVIVCRDSAKGSCLTIITEQFHSYRNTGALYFLGSKDVSVPQDQQIANLKAQLEVVLRKIIELLKAKLASLIK